MGFMIRGFRVEDHAAALRLWETSDGVGLGSSDTLEAVTQFLERNPGLSLVAVEGDVLVGTILCGHDGRRGFIHHLAVAPAYRRRGLGRVLVSGALAALRAAHITKCHLLVFHENVSGRQFWKHIGAEERVTLSTFSMVTGS
jgi:ribosomal protein S18 acetylase RimI-like enzyme